MLRNDLSGSLRRRRRGQIAPVDPMTTLLATLTGTRLVWDTTHNNSGLVAQGAGVATSLAEVNGGPAMPLTGSPTWDGTNKRIVFNGTTQCGDTALHASIKLDGDWGLIVIGEFPASGQVVGINDGTLSNYCHIGNAAGALIQYDAGGSGSAAPTANADANSSVLRLAMLSHGGASWTHPTSGTELAGRDGVNLNSEYSFLEYRGARGRGNPRQGRQTFVAGSRRITVGATANHGTFTAFVLKALIYLDHQPSYEEQLAIQAFALNRGAVMTGARNFAMLAGSSICGGAVGTQWDTLLQSVSPAPYAGTYAAAIPAASWDSINDASDSSGSREGQFVTHIRGSTNRARDLIGGAYNSSRSKQWFLYYEGYNDALFNTSLTQAQRAQVAINSAIRAYQAARAAGFIVIAHTVAKVNGPTVVDNGTPFNLGADPALVLPSEIRRFIYNNFWRENWQSYAHALWDPAGNINIRHTDAVDATSSWGGSYGVAGTLYTSANIPHPETAGNIEFVFAPGDSVYTAAYAAAYTAAWPSSPYPINAINGGPFKVGLWHVLHSLGIV